MTPDPTPGRPAADQGCPQAGQWVLLESGGRLLGIGDAPYGGQSPRNHLDGLARTHLLPLMARAQRDRAPADGAHRARGESWVFQARPVLGPSGEAHATLGCYTHAALEAPEPPRVGAWEWDAGTMRNYWSPELFGMLGYPEDPGRDHWEALEWFGLGERGGYAAMREVMARFAAARAEDLILHRFRFVRPDTGRPQPVRLAGRTVLGAGGAPRWFRGTTGPCPDFGRDGDHHHNHLQTLAAGLALTRSPLLVADPGDDLVFLNIGAPMESVGLNAPPDRRLASVVHPDDQSALAAFLAGVPEAAATGQAWATTARFAGPRGWKPVEVTAVRFELRVGGAEVAQVMIRLGP